MLAACGGGGGSGADAQSANPDPAPTVSISANPTSVDSGETATLNWSSTNATSCTGSGGWSGSKATSGSQATPALTQTTEFTLSCNGAGGGTVGRVTVTVNGTSGGSPTAQISATPPGVPVNGSTTLTWMSTNATSCTASGGWSGAKALNGSQSVGPIAQDQTYQLTCQGTGGNAIAMVSVDVRQAILSWTAPTKNTDGSALTNLSGYKLYWGNQSGSYGTPRTVDGADNTTQTIALSPGTYFFAVSAVDSGGNESALSNEVTKTVL
jgi:hypothetical protein